MAYIIVFIITYIIIDLAIIEVKFQGGGGIGKIDISYIYIYNYMRKIVDFIRYENISDMGKMN